MAKYYLKFRHDAVKDPKLMRLPDRLFRRFIELLCLAGELDQDGLLPNIDDMAWILHLDPAELTHDLQALSPTGMLQDTPDGWLITNFAKHQAAETGAERIARYRKAKRTGNEPVTNSYTNVTPPVTNTVPELELKIESESELKTEAAARAAEVPPLPDPENEIVSLYTQSIGSEPTPAIREKLALARQTYPAEWIPAAFAEAASYNGRSWAYVEAILQRWKTTGRKKTPRRGGSETRKRNPQRYAEWTDQDAEPTPAQQLYDHLLTVLAGDKSIPAVIFNHLSLARPEITDHTLQLIAQDDHNAEYIRQRCGRTLERILIGMGDYKLDIITEAQP